MSDDKLPGIYIMPEAMAKLETYIQLTTNEISGLGLVEPWAGDLLIRDVFILEQECSASETELDEKALTDFLVECVKQDLDPTTVRLWWHSHANMGTFWSSQDTSTIAKLRNDGWLLSIVGNRARDYRCRLDLWSPLAMTLDQLPLQIAHVDHPELKEQLQAEIEQKVRPLRYTYTPTPGAGVRVYDHDTQGWDYWTPREAAGSPTAQAPTLVQPVPRERVEVPARLEEGVGAGSGPLYDSRLWHGYYRFEDGAWHAPEGDEG